MKCKPKLYLQYGAYGCGDGDGCGTYGDGNGDGSGKISNGWGTGCGSGIGSGIGSRKKKIFYGNETKRI